MIVEDLIKNPTLIDGYYGYVYKTTFLDLNKSYIGKKAFFHLYKRKIGKKEAALIEGKGRKPKTEQQLKPSGWEDYYGSEKEVINLIKTTPKDRVIREVLQLCKSKKELTYYECKFLFGFEVLEKPDQFFNGNILGSFFRKDLNN